LHLLFFLSLHLLKLTKVLENKKGFHYFNTVIIMKTFKNFLKRYRCY
jgi:hypothetical protein